MLPLRLPFYLPLQVYYIPAVTLVVFLKKLHLLLGTANLQRALGVGGGGVGHRGRW